MRRLYLYHLGFSKTDQLGAEQNSTAEKPVAHQAADALSVWLETSKILSGSIFRRIRGAAMVGQPPVRRGRGIDREAAREACRSSRGLWRDTRSGAVS